MLLVSSSQKEASFNNCIKSQVAAIVREVCNNAGLMRKNRKRKSGDVARKQLSEGSELQQLATMWCIKSQAAAMTGEVCNNAGLMRKNDEERVSRDKETECRSVWVVKNFVLIEQMAKP